MIRIFVRLESIKVRLNLNFLSARLLHFHDLINGFSDVNVLTVLDEVFCLELAVGQHVFDVKSQLIGHLREILIYLFDTIVEIRNVLESSFINFLLIKLLHEVRTNSLDNARLIHD